MPDSATPPGQGGPAALDSAVLRITDQQGRCWGAGFLVAEQTALTCAHVVNAVLGTPEGQRPVDSARVFVDLPLLRSPGPGRDPVPARIVHFAAGDDDVAVLRLETGIPEGRPVRLVDAPEVWGHPARIFGFPDKRPGGVWHAGVLRSRQADGWIQTDLASAGYRVSGGFSGSPVWDEELTAVVGMVAVAESGDPAASYLIPTDALLRSWEPLRSLTLPASPFRGLAPFQEADAESFHGREEESDELAAEVTAERQVCLVGPSGSGKSSLALAGVVPRLRAEGFSVGVMRPASGSQPLSALAAALLPLLEPELSPVERLDRLPALVRVLAQQGIADTVAAIRERQGSRGLLLVVDQFEELLVADSDLVNELADVLYTADLPPGLHVLTTLRADFLEKALAHPKTAAALRNRIYALGAPGAPQLRRIVTAPVAAIPGVGYEAGLVERVLADAGEEPGVLPLLGFTLEQLWQHQHGGLLTHETYEALGGVTGALGRHAERLWSAHVPEPATPAARRLFAALVRVPLGTEATTRRTALRSELDAESWDIARKLADARLLVTGRSAEGVETVEVAHEALISGWQRLADWTEEDRAFLIWREALRHDKERWEHGGRTPDLLPTQPALEAAAHWLRVRGEFLTDDEHDYLRRGQEHQRARQRKRGIRIAVIASLTALAVLLGSLFAYYRYVGLQRTAESTSRALAQSSADLSTSDPVVSVMTALAAYRTSPTEQARDALLRARLAHHSDQRMLSGSDGSVRGVAASEDGEVLLVDSEVGKPTLYVHAASGTVRRQRLDLPYQAGLDFVSPDGRRAGFFTDARALVWFDVRRDGKAGELAGPAHRLPARLGSHARLSNVSDDAAISRDGRIVAQTGAGSTAVAWWDLERGTSGTVPLPPGLPKTSRFDGVHIGADGQKLLATVFDEKAEKSTLFSIDRSTRHAEVILPPSAHFVLSDAGNAVASCESSKEHGARAFVVRSTGRPTTVRRYTGKGVGNDDICPVAAVDDSGRWVATDTYDTYQEKSFSLFDLKRNRQTFSKPQQGAEELRKVVAVHGQPVMISSSEKSVLYTPASKEPAAPLRNPALSPDGKSVVGLSDDGNRIERHTADGPEKILARAERRYSGRYNDDWVLGFSADGKTVADQTGKNAVLLRRASDLRPLRTIRAVEPPANGRGEDDPGFSFFFHGDSVVTRSGTVLQQWDRKTGRRTAQVDLRRLIRGLSPKSEVTLGRYSGIGNFAVTVWGDPKVHIVNMVTGREIKVFDTGSDAASVKFDSTGKYLAILRRGGNVELWQSSPLRRKLGPFLAREGEEQEFVAQFLPDGKFLMASRTSLHVYDVAEGRSKDAYTFGVPGGHYSTGYSYIDTSVDGKTVLFRSDDVNEAGNRTIRLDAGMWHRQLCRMIGYREFTDEERQSLGAPVPEEAICHDG
ncbi:nSTAND1 domain-containing NTPase [Streptomyces angustmyceticus]